MPAVVAFVILLAARGTKAAFVFAWDLICEARRRVGRTYRTGYAMVPEGSAPGDTLGPDPFVVCLEPVSLPAFHVAGNVARIANATGIGSSFRQRGRWWEASAAEVSEILPLEVVFGRNGQLVVEVILAVLELTDEQATEARSTVDERLLYTILEADTWRAGLASQVRSGVTNSIRRHIASGIDLGTPNDDEDEAAQEAREAAWIALFEERLARWAAVITITANAGLAAALADELSQAEMEALSADWEQLVGWRSQLEMHTQGAFERAASLAGDPLELVERHPNIAAVATAALLIPGFAYVPLIALLTFAAFLSLSVGILVRRRLRRRGQRIDRGLWLPRGDGIGPVPPPEGLRDSMAAVGSPPSVIAVRHLELLLRRARVWVAMDGERPSQPERTLDWLARSGQPLPFAALWQGNEKILVAYTDGDRHRASKLHQGPEWTAETSFVEVVSRAVAIGAGAVVLDLGCEPATTIASSGFHRFLITGDEGSRSPHEREDFDSSV